MKISDRFEGCILGGAIGDAWGSAYEHKQKEPVNSFYPFGKPVDAVPKWEITDDTQFTLVTCEAILEKGGVLPEEIAKQFLQGYKRNLFRGMGSGTLMAMKGLQAGGHWSLVGRGGEFAAGNGAAMRIAPLAFVAGITREQIKDVSNITHRNDEAYVGALSVVLSIQAILEGEWGGEGDLLGHIVDQLPDTKVRDRLIVISSSKQTSISEIAKLGTSAYVVDSVPLAIFAASRVNELGIHRMYEELIAAGGDTDTNASIAGQIAGALIGKVAIPKPLLANLMGLNEWAWMEEIVQKMAVLS